MICPISDDNKESLFDFLVDHLDGVVDTKAPFSLKGLVASVYNEFGKDVPSDQALSFAHQVPSYLRELIKAEPTYFEYLAGDIKSIVDLQKNFNTDNPLMSVANYLKDVVSIDTKTLVKVVKDITNRQGFTTAPQDDEFRNETTDTKRIKDGIDFNAKPLNVNSTTGNEADSKGIPFAEKAQRYGFIRHILNMMFKADIQDSTDLPLVPGGIRLSAMTAKNLGKDKPASVNGSAVVVVITDDKGNVLRFNNKYELSEDGNAMFYALRSIAPDKSGKAFTAQPEVLSVENAVRKLNLKGNPITQKAYREDLQANMEFLYKLKQHLQKNPDDIIQMVIDGGSHGYIPYDENTVTMLSDINFSDDPLNIIIQKGPVGPFYAGAAYFNVRGVSNPILISRRPMDRDLAEKIASTVVDTVRDVNTSNQVYELSNAKKLDLVLQYRANTDLFGLGLDKENDRIVVLMIGKAPMVVSPETKEEVRKNIIDFFTTPQQMEIPEPASGTPVINGDSDAFDASTVRIGSVVKFKIGESTKYYKYIIPEFTINKNLLDSPESFNHYSLTTQADGSHMIVNRVGDTNGGMNYMKFVKANAFVKYSKAPGDNKLRQLNAYFTFQVPEDQKRKVVPVADTIEEILEEQQPEKVEEPTKPTKSATDKFIDDIYLRGLHKTLIVKTGEQVATPEQVAKAKQWFDKSPLKDKIGFEEMFNIMNSEAVAEFFDGAIRLYHGSDYSDLYHESWHAFSQMFLTIEDKIKLYREVQARTGSFVTNTGKRVAFNEATYEEIEEYLAEDFRNYMLADGKSYNGKVRNSIFRKILNFLKALFGDTTYQQTLINERSVNTVNELFEKLRVGNLTGYSFNAENQMFGKLNKGIQATKKTDAVQSLSASDSILARQTIDSIFSTLQDTLNARTGKQYTTHIFRTLRGRMTAYSAALEILKEKRADLLEKIGSTPEGLSETNPTVLNAYVQSRYDVGTEVSYVDNKGESATGEVTGYLTDVDSGKISHIKVNGVNVPLSEVTDTKRNTSLKSLEEGQFNLEKRNLDTLSWMINNYGDPMDKKSYGEDAKGVIAYHSKKSEYLSYEDRGMEDAADNNTPERFKLAGDETSVFEGGKPEVWYMIRGLQKMKKVQVGNTTVYEPVLNRLGFPELIEFDPVKNRLAKILSNSPSVQDMHQRLLKEQKDTRFYYLNQLMSKLGDPSNQDPQVQEMWGAFFQTFNRYYIDQPIVFMDLVNGSWKTRTGSSFGDRNGIKRMWDVYFAMASTNSPYVTRSDKSRAARLDLAALRGRYPSAAAIDSDRVGFIRDLGIPIDATDVNIRDEVYSNKAFNDFGKYMLARVNLLINNKVPIGDVRTFFSKGIMDGGKERQENRLYNAIVDLFVEFNDMYSDASLSTPEGDTRYALSLNSSMTAVAKILSNSRHFSQDVLSSPLAYLDHSRNPFAKRSWSLYSMYDPQTGARRGGSGYIMQNVSGLTILENGESIDLGINASSADETAKLMMDIAYFIQHGIIANVTPGEKSTRLSTRVAKYFYTAKTGRLSKTGKIWMDVEHFSKAEEGSLSTKIYQSILPYLLAETERISIMKRASANPQMVENNYDTYKKNGMDFLLFDQMLSPKTKEDIKSLLNKEGFDLEVYLDSNTEEALALRTAISNDFMKYWNNEFNKNISLYQKGGLITDDILASVVNSSPAFGKYINFAVNKGSKTELEMAILKAFTFNTFIHNTEATILNYGDPAQYASAVEFHKRVSMFSSTGEIFRTDSSMMSTLNQLLVDGYAKSIGIDFKGSLTGGYFSSVLNSAIMDDPKLNSAYLEQIREGLAKNIRSSWEKYRDDFKNKKTSEKDKLVNAEVDRQVKAYIGMKIADAQGWVTFDSYRLMAKSMNDWSPAQEELFQKIVNGEDVDMAETIKYFPVMKYQYAGPLATNEGLPVMAGHKFSLMPLIPNVIKNSPSLVALHEKMMRSNVDYATMKSGSKITTITHGGKPDLFYKDNDLTKREFDAERNDDGSYVNPFMPNKVYMDFLKKQQPTTSEFKESSIFATQLRKIIEEGLVEGGVPTDFMPEEKDLTTKMRAWEKLSEDKKQKYPKYVLYTAYEKALKDLTEKKKEKLLKSIGWDKEENYGKVNTKLLEFLKKEMQRQDMSDHEMSYLDIMYNGSLKYEDLSLHLSQELVEKVLLSIVNRNLIRQKVNGEPLIQVSGLGWENMNDWNKGYNLTNPTQEQLDKFGTNGLTYYQPGKGPNGSTSAMKVKIALQGNFKELLKHRHKDGEAIQTIARLNEMINDEEWLNTGNNRKMITMVGVRIPVQGLNSMEFMQVQEFLPEDAGNAIILPAEIVAKSGSDFDIDKLSIYMPNIKEVDGIVNLESGDTEGAAENKLLDAMYDILSNPDNYASLVRPNDVYTLSPIANDAVDGIRDYVSDYNPKVGLDGDKLADISGSDLMQYRYNLYVHVVNKVAQEALGIAAVDNTFNIMFNRVGAYMNKEYLDGTQRQLSARTPQGVTKEITLFMPHNTILNKINEKVISLSHMMDAKGQEKISDNISQIINLVLEIAKNDSAFYLQLNREVVPTLLFLNQAGVPIKQLIYFASHPVIREYMNEIRKARTPISAAIGTAPEGDRNFFVAHARRQVMENHGMIADSEQEAKENPSAIYMGAFRNPKGKDAHRNMYARMMSLARNADGTNSDIAKSAFDETNLLNKIKQYDPKNPSYQLSEEDQLVLLHWFHIEDFSKSVRDIKMRLNFDTNRNKSAFMFANKKAAIESFAADKRLPYSVVEDILENSPISSFYLVDKTSGNPFITDLLEPLLPLRANPKVTAFLNSKLGSFKEKEEIEDTFGNVDRFVNKFFNDFVAYIFQDKLRSFDITSIKGYKNLVADRSVSVEKVPFLKFGAFVKDGVMYIDTKQLIKDFQEGNYLSPGTSKTISGDNYQNRGLAPVGTKTAEVFSTPGEYFNFVLEREYIRNYIKFDDVAIESHFIGLRVANVKNFPKGKEEPQDSYNTKIDALTYEQWIRDKALDNIGNGWKLFYSENNYAQQVIDAFGKYGLREQYPLLENIIIDERKTRKGNVSNLRLLDYDLTGEKIDAYHRIFSDLANPAILKTDNSGRPLDQLENQRLSELFARLPVVAFLQSGLTTAGQFSLTRLVPAEKVMDFLSGVVPDFVNKLDINALNRFYSKFIMVNKDYVLRNRYKDYTQGMLPTAAERTKLTQAYGAVQKEGAVAVYGFSPFFGLYDTGALNINSASKTAQLFPDRVFVYDAAMLESSPSVGSSGYFTPEKSKATNVLGIPTQLRYGKKEADALSDDTLNENMLAIEKAIQRIKVEAKTKKLTFSDTGYGQSLVNVAPMTFMYLSQRLFEEFSYVNPNYEGQKLIEKPEPIDREPSNITDVDLTQFLTDKKKALGKWKKDSEVMNNSQAAIGYPIAPTDTYESSSVAYAKALNTKGIKTGTQSFNGVKAVWIFGNLSGKGGITETMLKAHFETVYKDRIDDAISQGVEIFNIGDAKSGIDVMAANYLKTLGFRQTKQNQWSSWTKQKETPIGELTFSPEMIGMIKSGNKKTMSGNIDLTPGLYKLSDGSMVRISAPIVYNSIRDVTKALGTAENWAKGEGYSSLNDLKTNTPSEFLKSFARGAARNMMTYPIVPEVGPREKAITELNKRLLEEEDVIILENEDDYLVFDSYDQLLTAYENGEIPPALTEDAYNELSRVNLLKYLYYNPNQLSLSFPSQAIQNGEILEPSQVLASKSVVSDKDVMDQIMRCITG